MGNAIKTVKLKLYKPNKGKTDYLLETKMMYDKALDFFINFIVSNSLVLEERFPLRAIESLCLKDFYQQFPGFPSVTKRSVINAAIGMVQGYLSNYENWKKSGSKKDEPHMPTASTMPTFYKGDYGIEYADIQNQFIRLRVYNGNEWILANYPVKFTQQFLTLYAENEKAKEYNKDRSQYKKLLKQEGLDKKEIKASMSQYPVNPYWECLSPSLSFDERKHEWYICFPFKKEIKVDKIEEQIKNGSIKRTLAVDLGLHHTAVVTIMEGNKLIYTEFIDTNDIDDIRYERLIKITEHQRLSGTPTKGVHSDKELWQSIYNINNDTAHKISRKIVGLALQYNCQIIIFEKLSGFKAKKKQSKAKKLNLKLNYWMYGKIIEYTKYKAYAEGILTKQVNPFMTSQICYKNELAGERFSPADINGKSLIMFTDGTILNADFNGSMNLHRKFWRTFPSLKGRKLKEEKKEIKKQIIEKTSQQCGAA
ncbi:MAG: putative transposase [Clostridiales bacterium]|jgi:IS605 OrfB family transposase|nr:putative transposase [Clostridiales bacterium]MDK2992726.1 putative transposase [Clostridiales bacterium]